MNPWFRVEGDRGVLRDYYPSEIWWRSEDSCRDLARQRWGLFATDLKLRPVGKVTLDVNLDEDHPHRMRTVVVSAVVETIPREVA
jgi:hypothetical protein